MHVQDVLPKIVDLVNFASTRPSLVVLAKRRGDVVREHVITSHLTTDRFCSFKKIKDETNTSIGNYMSIKFHCPTLFFVRNAYKQQA